MPSKPPSLSVHRNTIERRHKKQMQARMVSDARFMGQGDVLAYAIVAINSDGSAIASWDTGSTVPLWSFADVVRGILSEDILSSGIQDTWKPSLQERKK